MSWLRTEVEKIVKETASKSYTLGKVIKLKDTTVDVEPINGDPVLFNVKLQVNASTQGWAVKPKLNSEVLVGHVDGNEKNCFVAMFSEVDSVMINGDGNGGLIKIQSLVDKLNNLENKVNDIITKYGVHTHLDPVSGATGTPSAIVTGAITPTVKNELENEKVKHG